MISRTNSRVSSLSQRSSIVSGYNNKRERLESRKNYIDEMMSNPSDNSDQDECEDDDDDDVFRMSHSSMSSLDSDMTEGNGGTRRIKKVVRDVLRKDLKSFATGSLQVRLKCN